MKIFRFNIIYFVLIYTVFFVRFDNQGNKNITNNQITTIKANESAIDTFFIHEESKYIPLQTIEQSLIGDIVKVRLHNNEIFILDKSRKSIIVFRIDGQYNRELAKMGKGPGEYIVIRDFYIANENLYILDNDGSIIGYDIENLDFMVEYKKPDEMFNVHNFFVDSKYFYLSYHNIDKNDYYIHVCVPQKGQFKEIDNLVKMSTVASADAGLMMDTHEAGSIQPITCDAECGFVFNQSFDNYIYEIKNGMILKRYEMDFGDFGFPNELKMQRLEEKLKYARQNSEARVLGNYAKYEEKFIFEILLGLDIRYYLYIFYDTKLNDSKVFRRIIFPENKLNVKLKGTYNKGIIGLIDNETINAKIAQINAKIEENIKILDQEQEFLKIFNENSNPALVLFDIDDLFAW